MLSLDKPIGPIHGIVVYKDHADTNQYYYLPERPRLSRDDDGVPEFLLYKYRRDITDNPAFDPTQKQALGGGFLAFTTDLGVDDDVLGEVRSAVARTAGGNVVLSPVQCHTGTVRLSISKDTAVAAGAPPNAPTGINFFEEVYGTTVPSLYGDNRATFALGLGEEAATLMEAAMRSGISPIGVIYDLQFLGMRPAFDVKVTANYSRIYSSLELQFGITASYASIGVKAEIDMAWQKLREDGSIKVEVTKFTDDDALRKQADAAFDWMKTMLLQDFFSPAISPPSWMRAGAAPAAGTAPGVAAQAAAAAQRLTGTQSGASRPAAGAATQLAPTVAAPVTRLASGIASTAATNTAVAGPGASTVAPPVAAPAAAVGVPAAPAPGAPTPPAHPPVTTPPRPPSAPVRATNPPAPSPLTALPSPGAAAGSGFGLQLSFTLKSLHQEELKTREFEFTEQASEIQEVAPQGMFSTMVNGVDLSHSIKEISLDDEFFRRLITTFTMGADLAVEGIDNVAVNMEYPANRPTGVAPTASDGALFNSTSLTPHTFTSWLDAAKSLDFQYQMQIEFSAQSEWVGKSSKVVSPWIVSRARQLAIDPLDVIGLLNLPISIGSLDPTISQVQVTVVYEDAANAFTTSRTFLLHQGDPVSYFKVRLSDASLRSYRYQVTYMFKNNVRYIGDWVTSSDASLVINDPFLNVINLRLVPVLDGNNLDEADVQIVYNEAGTQYEHRTLVTFAPPASTTALVSIPTLARRPVGFTYAATIVRADGTMSQPGPTTATVDDTAIAIHDGDGQTHRVLVKLVDPNLASAGLVAVKVEVIGPDGDRAEVIFTPTQLADTRVTLIAAAAVPWSYRFQATGYGSTGLPRIGDVGDSTDPTLLVRLPTEHQ